MTRNRLLAFVLLAGLAACTGPGRNQPNVPSPDAAQAQGRPNIIFMMADDHAAHALSAYRPFLRYGAEGLPETPNLDRLAAEGMLFVNAFVTNSICGPSRAASAHRPVRSPERDDRLNAGSFHPTNVAFLAAAPPATRRRSTASGT
jgi:hypothetical protein